MPKETKWTLYLTRPFSLFGASIWAEWYISPAFRDVFGVQAQVREILLVEKKVGLVNQYRKEDNLKVFEKSIINLLLKERKKCLNFLKEGRKLNEKIKKVFEGKESFSDMRKAVDFFNEQSVKATILPTFVGKYMDELGIDDREMLQLVTELKSVSFYDRFIKEVLQPYAQRTLLKQRISNKNAAELITIREVLNHKTETIKIRLAERKRRHLFVYEISQYGENIHWTNNNTNYIQDLEGVSESKEEHKEEQLQGMCAFAGKVMGRARIVVTNDFRNIPFHEGDILIAVSTNPILMPLMLKCGAIVTDEGGMLSHATIISRELKKPCVVGTKRATSVINDGDMVEVDAEKGIVKKIS